MAINQKQVLSLQQKLSPQQIQMIKLLELPTVQLEQRIKQEIEDNIVLEEEERNPEDEQPQQISVEEYLREDDTPSYKSRINNYSKDDKQRPVYLSGGRSLQEYLIEQLGYRSLTERDMRLAVYLVGSIDEDGYLRRDLESVADDIAFTVGIETSVPELERVLATIHELEPAGVGARNLQECLLLQMGQIPMNSRARRLARKIVAGYFDEFVKKHYEKLISRLQVSEDDFREALAEIKHLSPKPGNLYSEGGTDATPYIIPDFILDYHDGQFDDSRMAINLAQTCIENGGTVVNQASVTGIVHDDAGRAAGVKFVDNLTGEEHTIKARSVVNAAGCFVDDIMHMDSPTHRKMVTPSQGVHLVLDMKFLQSDYAIMVPKTSDGRVLFAVPWHDKVVVGTTDIVRPKAEEDPRPLKEEIDFILGTAGLYMNPAPTYKDILSVFAGQRPLAAPKKEGKNTKEISRSHKVITSDNGLVTITGGKWTSYRLMAEDTVDKAIEVAGLPRRKCVTKKFHIHGYRKNPNLADHMYVYGSDEPKILNLIKENPALGEKLSPKFGYTLAEVVWAVREEMALTVEDVLARRVRLLFVDAREAMAAAPKVAETMARELGRDQAWIDAQVESFTKMAKNYIFEA